jgi:hypothetical protein
VSLQGGTTKQPRRQCIAAIYQQRGCHAALAMTKFYNVISPGEFLGISKKGRQLIADGLFINYFYQLSQIGFQYFAS